MATRHIMRAGNLEPPFLAVPLDRNGARIDPAALPVGTTGRFWMRPERTRLNTVDAVCDLLTATDAAGSYLQFRYRWQPADVVVPGIYRTGTALVYSDGTELAFPNDDQPVWVQVTAE